ncbi:MAG: type II toxin-antitoxin system mRNA interferase toxin, RelE/StbE family [Candidatus Marinimicrobia bacterium CG08_land_8_20_14_0_20_45_22]|nr:MAG: type II toxin-antitoxin system mRNA interferase toxin, RelE/StbE family [Candidatus Marinimicrobia bacterium CG08_land_8_20_14_0_20_45_22]
MRQIHFTTAFKKDYQKAIKRGWNISLLDEVISLLATGEVLPKKFKVHPLQGRWSDFSECHIKPDWLLIWKQETNDICLTRTGTHSDLY